MESAADNSMTVRLQREAVNCSTLCTSLVGIHRCMLTFNVNVSFHLLVALLVSKSQTLNGNLVIIYEQQHLFNVFFSWTTWISQLQENKLEMCRKA